MKVDRFDQDHGFADALRQARRSRACGLVSFDPQQAKRATRLALTTPVDRLA